MAKKWPFLDPCGAKSRGSGGAPPTHLILLRNQWSAYREIVAPAHQPPARSARGSEGWSGALLLTVGLARRAAPGKS